MPNKDGSGPDGLGPKTGICMGNRGWRWRIRLLAGWAAGTSQNIDRAENRPDRAEPPNDLAGTGLGRRGGERSHELAPIIVPFLLDNWRPIMGVLLTILAPLAHTFLVALRSSRQLPPAVPKVLNER
jgi:hypothetical protein